MLFNLLNKAVSMKSKSKADQVHDRFDQVHDRFDQVHDRFDQARNRIDVRDRYEDVRDRFEDVGDKVEDAADRMDFSWWWLLVIPAVFMVGRWLLNQLNSEAARLQSWTGDQGMIPATGKMGAVGQKEAEHQQFHNASKEHTVPEMAEFGKGQPKVEAVQTVPAKEPKVSEDSEVHISGPTHVGTTEPGQKVNKLAEQNQSGYSNAMAQEGTAASTPSEAHEPKKKDDLRVIEGIGPSIEDMLHKSGILTFEQLSKASQERLNQVLEEGKIRQLADPTTWPEQASLAAEGKWDELSDLQDHLRHGRRVD